MALGFLNKNYDSRVLAYDDEQTPTKLTGIKMLPIWQGKDGTTLNESLDIIRHLDPSNSLGFTSELEAQLEPLLNKLGSNVHNLAMPYWMWTPEFTPSAREYFEVKKSKKRGPFNKLVAKRSEFEVPLLSDLCELSKELKPWYQSAEFSLADIMIASHLWGLYIVPEFRFSDQMHSYLQSVKKRCQFDYHLDFWR
tara:strand:- start:48 stop:632 length:585 start_codon:yes stop_codon:yes gene_type:complete